MLGLAAIAFPDWHTTGMGEVFLGAPGLPHLSAECVHGVGGLADASSFIPGHGRTAHPTLRPCFEPIVGSESDRHQILARPSVVVAARGPTVCCTPCIVLAVAEGPAALGRSSRAVGRKRRCDFGNALIPFQVCRVSSLVCALLSGRSGRVYLARSRAPHPVVVSAPCFDWDHWGALRLGIRDAGGCGGNQLGVLSGAGLWYSAGSRAGMEPAPAGRGACSSIQLWTVSSSNPADVVGVLPAVGLAGRDAVERVLGLDRRSSRGAIPWIGGSDGPSGEDGSRAKRWSFPPQTPPLSPASRGQTGPANQPTAPRPSKALEAPPAGARSGHRST